jgi:pimeloyl-ACP methyl ester carboxylesterase
MSRLEPWLQRSGWDTRRAPVGRNNMAAQVVMAVLEDWLEETAAEEGGPVAVNGHSRGGQQARVLAVRRPEDVSLLVTLGAPLRVLYPPHVLVQAPAVALRARARVRRQPTDHEGNARYESDRTAPFPDGIPFVSVFSRTDGFVDGRTCLDPAADPVEIDCTHFGLTTSVPAFQAIADALRRLDG